MLQVMCSKNNRQRCDGSCDEPNCMMKHPPTITTWCGSCNELRAQIESITREKAELANEVAELKTIRDNQLEIAERAKDARCKALTEADTLRAELDAAFEMLRYVTGELRIVSDLHDIGMIHLDRAEKFITKQLASTDTSDNDAEKGNG